MTRARKLAVPATSPVSSAGAADDIMHVKVWLLGISPTVWRRVLVPDSFSLRELHGVLQVAMATSNQGSSALARFIERGEPLMAPDKGGYPSGVGGHSGHSRLSGGIKTTTADDIDDLFGRS
jgi:hypothetical protein